MILFHCDKCGTEQATITKTAPVGEMAQYCDDVDDLPEGWKRTGAGLWCPNCAPKP